MHLADGFQRPFCVADDLVSIDAKIIQAFCVGSHVLMRRINRGKKHELGDAKTLRWCPVQDLIQLPVKFLSLFFGFRRISFSSGFLSHFETLRA